MKLDAYRMSAVWSYFSHLASSLLSSHVIIQFVYMKPQFCHFYQVSADFCDSPRIHTSQTHTRAFVCVYYLPLCLFVNQSGKKPAVSLSVFSLPVFSSHRIHLNYSVSCLKSTQLTICSGTAFLICHSKTSFIFNDSCMYVCTHISPTFCSCASTAITLISLLPLAGPMSCIQDQVCVFRMQCKCQLTKAPCYCEALWVFPPTGVAFNIILWYGHCYCKVLKSLSECVLVCMLVFWVHCFPARFYSLFHFPSHGCPRVTFWTNSFSDLLMEVALPFFFFWQYSKA